jgi:hypothetical protein
MMSASHCNAEHQMTAVREMQNLRSSLQLVHVGLRLLRVVSRAAAGMQN